jgi:hypothetical protein
MGRVLNTNFLEEAATTDLSENGDASAAEAPGHLPGACLSIGRALRPAGTHVPAISSYPSKRSKR